MEDYATTVIAKNGPYELVRYDFEFGGDEYVIKDGMMELEVFTANRGDDEAIREFDAFVGAKSRR